MKELKALENARNLTKWQTTPLSPVWGRPGTSGCDTRRSTFQYVFGCSKSERHTDTSVAPLHGSLVNYFWRSNIKRSEQPSIM